MKILEFWLRVIVLTICLSLCSAFDCDSVSDQPSCSQLKGCNWNQSTCEGTFSPICNRLDSDCSSITNKATCLQLGCSYDQYCFRSFWPTWNQSNCYYIDPMNGIDLHDGSPQTPFKTLTKGLQMLSSKDGRLIVINYKSQPKTDVLNFVNITTFMTIMPLFNESSFIISLENFNTLASDDQENAITISSGIFQIIGATVNSATVTASVNTIFELGNARFSLHNVSILEDVGDIYLVNTTGIKPSSEFYINGGNYSGSSFLFKINGGKWSINELEFHDTQGSHSHSLFNVSGGDLTIFKADVT